jgi:argininosuccinate lyase
MQEDKEALFDTIDTLGGSLSVMTTVLRNVTINEARMLEATNAGYLNATDLADYLVRKGLEFRKAHEVVGRVVMHSMESRKRLDELPIEELRRFSPLFDSDCYRAIELGASLESKEVVGGTAPEGVARRLAEAWAELNRE